MEQVQKVYRNRSREAFLTEAWILVQIRKIRTVQTLEIHSRTRECPEKARTAALKHLEQIQWALEKIRMERNRPKPVSRRQVQPMRNHRNRRRQVQPMRNHRNRRRQLQLKKKLPQRYRKSRSRRLQHRRLRKQLLQCRQRMSWKWRMQTLRQLMSEVMKPLKFPSVITQS